MPRLYVDTGSVHTIVRRLVRTKHVHFSMNIFFLLFFASIFVIGIAVFLYSFLILLRRHILCAALQYDHDTGKYGKQSYFFHTIPPFTVSVKVTVRIVDHPALDF